MGRPPHAHRPAPRSIVPETHMILVIALAAALAASQPPAASPARPARLAATARDSILKAIQKDRTDTEEWLKTSSTSYLATVQRRDFDDKTTLVVGRDAACDVRIDDPEIAARHLSVTVVGDSFAVKALDDTAHFRVKDHELRAATLGPSGIRIGRFGLRLSHQRFPAIIVFDPRSPHFSAYHGLRYYPPDLSWRYELPLTANPRPDTILILSTRGNQRRAVRVGWFDFLARGVKCRLEATRLLEPGVGENDFSIFFRDATTGRETYDVGRYVDVQPLGAGRYVLDFNMAYNPACAVSEHYNCPIPPKANALKVAVRAGEKDAHYH
jgi:uncharacterized protein (DUF1684 family)